MTKFFCDTSHENGELFDAESTREAAVAYLDQYPNPDDCVGVIVQVYSAIDRWVGTPGAKWKCIGYDARDNFFDLISL